MIHPGRYQLAGRSTLGNGQGSDFISNKFVEEGKQAFATMIVAIAITLHDDPAKRDRIVDQASLKNGGRIGREGKGGGLIYGNDLYFSCIDSAPLPWAAR